MKKHHWDAKVIGLVGVFLLSVVLAANDAAGVGRDWDGSSSTSWTTTANWTPSGTPASSDSLTIGYVDAPNWPAAGMVYMNDGGGVVVDDTNGYGATASFTYLYAGSSTLGGFGVVEGGTASTQYLFAGRYPGATGAAHALGSGSTLTVSRNIYVGHQGTGEVLVSQGADMECTGSSSDAFYVGYRAGSSGTVTVDDLGSLLDTGVCPVYVGYGDDGAATGTLNITDGGDVHADTTLYVGYNEGATGTISLEDSGSTLNTGYSPLYVGYEGQGTMEIKGGADVDSGYAYIGRHAAAMGAVLVDGSGSTWDLMMSATFYDTLFVGEDGTGTLDVTNGADGRCSTVYIGADPGSTGTLTLDGAGSTLTVRVSTTGSYTGVYVGDYGTGTLTIQNGADLDSGSACIGYTGVADGTVIVDGVGSTWELKDAGNDLFVGTGTATGRLDVKNHAAVTIPDQLDIGAQGSVYLYGGKISCDKLLGDGRLYFYGGELEVGNDDVEVAPGTPLGSSVSMGTGQVLDVQTGDLQIKPGASLSCAGGTITVGGAFTNEASFYLSSGGVLEGATSATNRSSMTLSGATVENCGAFTNDWGATLSAKGALVGTSLDNNGTLNLTGLLTLAEFSDNTNFGTIDVGTGEALRLAHSSTQMDNYGLVELNSGAITGAGTMINYPGGIIRGGSAVSVELSNAGGLIHANGATTLVLNRFTGNTAGGELRVDDGSAMYVNSSSVWDNDGAIVLLGESANLSGQSINNNGTLRGAGRVSNTVYNHGVIRPEGGQLTVSGSSCSNYAGGLLEIADGTTLFYTQGLGINQAGGTIALTGGKLDTNSNATTNSGDILGRGTVRTGGLTNVSGAMVHFADGTADVYGTVQNNVDGDVQMTDATVTFFNHVTNDGDMKNTSSTARFLGGMTNNGTYASDPADNYFSDVSVGTAGVFTGGTGDRFFVSGDFANASTAAAAWDTSDAELIFQGGAGHAFEMPGSDIGAFYAGLVDNFAWGTVRLVSGDSLLLADGNLTPGAATYVTSLILEGGLGQIGSITGNGFSIYYDPLSPDNTYLNAQTYPLTGGGVVAPMSVPLPVIPEPAGLGLIGLAALAARRRRR